MGRGPLCLSWVYSGVFAGVFPGDSCCGQMRGICPYASQMAERAECFVRAVHCFHLVAADPDPHRSTYFTDFPVNLQ